jgi:hypothetical protein
MLDIHSVRLIIKQNMITPLALYWGRRIVGLRVWAVIALTLTSCTTLDPVPRQGAAEAGREIRYVSSDLRFVMIFSNGNARSGDLSALSPGVWPSFPTRAVQTTDHVQCISFGPAGNAVEFAIKRPIRAGDRYTCLNTSFLVTRCFEDCLAAVVEVEAPPGGTRAGVDTIKSYMYVDSCRGVLVFSQIGNLAEGIPLGAEWLRGEVGILADPHYPGCDRP